MNTKTPTFKKVPLADVIANASAQVTELPWFEGFHAGSHIDRHSKAFEFKRADLQQMVDNFVPDTIPFLTTHPEANEPSYGFAKEIKLTEDDKLYLNGDNVDVGFATSVIKGNFGKRSLGLDYNKEKGWHIDHVAFLGAVKPSLTLAPVGEYNFSAAPSAFDFSVETQTANVLVKLMRGFKSYLQTSGMSKEDIESFVNEWEIDWLQRASIRQEIEEEQQLGHQFSQAPESDPININENNPEQENNVSEFTKKQLDDAVAAGVATALASQKADFSQCQQTDKDRIAELEKNNQTMQFNQRVNANQQWVESQLKANTLKPAQAAGLAEFMAHIDVDTDAESGKFEFSRPATGKDATPEKVKQSPVEFMKALVENSTKHNLTQGAEREDFTAESGDPEDINALALEYQTANKCTYQIALDAVTGG